LTSNPRAVPESPSGLATMMEPTTGIRAVMVVSACAMAHSPPTPRGDHADPSGWGDGADTCRLIGETSPGPEFSPLRHRQAAAVPAVRGAPGTSEAPRRLVFHHSPGRPMVVVGEACLLSARGGMPLAVLQHAAARRNPARAASRKQPVARIPALHLDAAARGPRGA
jgi:hypothetical protein